MKLTTNRKLTALPADNVSKNGCSTVYNFWHLLFFHAGHMHIKNFNQNPSSLTSSLYIQLNNTRTLRHSWDQLSRHRALPVSAVEVLQGGLAFFFLLSFLILAIVQTVFYAIAVAHTIAIAVSRPLFPLHYLPPSPFPLPSLDPA